GAAEPTKPAGAGRNDADAVGLDAAIGLPRPGHGDRLGLLQVRGLANHSLAHDHALVERDFDISVAAGVMDRQAVGRQIGDGTGCAAPRGGSGCTGGWGCAGAGTGGGQAAAPSEPGAAGPCAVRGCGGAGGRAATTDFVAAVKTAE